MGCCGSKNIDQTVVSKAEREETVNKTSDEVTSMNEFRIIEFEAQNILDLLISKTPSDHSFFIEYILYFIGTLHENLHNATQKNAKNLDPQALQIIRTNLQKLNGVIKGEANFQNIREEDPNGIKINKILQDFELNVMVLIQGKLGVTVTKPLLQSKEKTYDHQRFSFILASNFWVEDLRKQNEQDSTAKWIDFKHKFTDFATNYFQVSIKEEDFCLVRQQLDPREDQIVNYRDWNDFYKKTWLNWKLRRQFFEQKLEKAERNSPKQLNLVILKCSTSGRDVEISHFVSVKANEQFLSKNGKKINKNLYEESLLLQEDFGEDFFKFEIFMKKNHQFYVKTQEKHAKCLLGLEKFELFNEIVLETKEFMARVVEIDENKLNLEIYDRKFNLIGKYPVISGQNNDFLTKFGFPTDLKIERLNNSWFVSRTNEFFIYDAQNVVSIFLQNFDELKANCISPNSKELNAGMTLNFDGNLCYLTEGEYVQPKFLAKKEEENKNLNFVETKLEKKVSSPKKKLNKSNSVAVGIEANKKIIVTSKGQKINVNIVNRIQILEKLFTGVANADLPIEEEEKYESPATTDKLNLSKKASSKRKRSESLKYVKSPSGKKSIHVNILDRVMLLEKHFGSSSSSDQIDFSAYAGFEKEGKKEEEPEMEKIEEEDIYGPNGMVHLTLARPKHPTKHKKKSTLKRMVSLRKGT